jgi:hypothetical protein
MQVQRKTPAIVILRKMGPPSIFRQGCQCGEPEWEGGKWVSEATRKKKTQDVKKKVSSKQVDHGRNRVEREKKANLRSTP